MPVWTPHAISLALNTWVATHVGRDDIGFVWDPQIPESEHVTKAKQIAAKLQAGEHVDSYTIGEGIAATGDAFDFLLGLPHTAAAEVTTQLAEIQRQLAQAKESE